MRTKAVAPSRGGARLDLDDRESTQCVCWPARSTRSASAVARAGRRRHRTLVHAKPQLHADRERGRATDDAARLEIGESEGARVSGRQTSRGIKAGPRIGATPRGCPYSPMRQSRGLGPTDHDFEWWARRPAPLMATSGVAVVAPAVLRFTTRTTLVGRQPVPGTRAEGMTGCRSAPYADGRRMVRIYD